MAKGDIYYLIDPYGYVIYKFEFTDDYMTGKCYECYSWNTDKTPYEYHFFADVYCKPDSCTHWRFYGEDYDEEIDGDSYYHICGADCFKNHIRAMCFIWKLALKYNVKSVNKDSREWVARNYMGDLYLRDLVKTILKDYQIVKEKTDEMDHK